MAAGDEGGVGGWEGGEVGSPWPFLPSRTPGPGQLAGRSPGPASGRDGERSGYRLPQSLPPLGAGAGMGQPTSLWLPHHGLASASRLQVTLLLSKVVLKGDGFLIEIQSIGTEARRAQHEHTSGEIALGPRGVRGRGREPGTPRRAGEAANERPWLVLVGIHRVPDRDSALPSLLLGTHGAPNHQRGLQARCVSLWHPDRVWLMNPRRVPKSVRGGVCFGG